MNTPPTHATSPRLTLGDLERTITVAQAREIAASAAAAVEEHLEAVREHWTDDEGLHELPYRKQVEEQMPGWIDGAIYAALARL